VYGFGERKTPDPFVAACDKFIYTEILIAKPDEEQPLKPRTAAELKRDGNLVNLLRNAVDAASDDDGWAGLGGVGSIITKQRPNFDSRSYGYGKLSELITATTLFEMDRRSPGDGRPKVIYVRNKTKAAKPDA
jgi:hypothetical protein